MEQVELNREKEDQLLTRMFNGSLQTEFPIFYQMIEKQRRVKKKLCSASAPTMWEDCCNIVADYLVKEGVLRVNGYLYPSKPNNYIAAYLTLRNGSSVWAETIGEYNYISERGLMHFEEKIKMKRGQIKKLEVEFSNAHGVFGCSNELEKRKFTISVGNDIVSKVFIEHPRKSKGSGNVINIIYQRGGDYDYCYTQPGGITINNPFIIQFPFRVGVVLDDGFELHRLCHDKCTATLLRQGQNPCKFNNHAEIRMESVVRWTWQKDKYESTPPEKFINQIKNERGYGYVLEFPRSWNIPIDPDPINVSGDYKYQLSLEVCFICTDHQEYWLYVNSIERPGSYGLVQEGNQVEVPYFHILWGCVGKDTPVKRMAGLGSYHEVLVSDIKIGDIVWSQNSGKKVINIAKGTEEIMFFVKAENMELPILLTRHHPLLTEKGWKKACELKVGDVLSCEGGSRKVQEVYPEPYYDEVFSLELEDGEGFWAAGYYVGDLKKQNNMAPKQDVLPPLPPEFLAELKKFQEMK